MRVSAYLTHLPLPTSHSNVHETPSVCDSLLGTAFWSVADLDDGRMEGTGGRHAFSITISVKPLQSKLKISGLYLLLLRLDLQSPESSALIRSYSCLCMCRKGKAKSSDNDDKVMCCCNKCSAFVRQTGAVVPLESATCRPRQHAAVALDLRSARVWRGTYLTLPARASDP